MPRSCNRLPEVSFAHNLGKLASMTFGVLLTRETIRHEDECFY